MKIIKKINLKTINLLLAVIAIALYTQLPRTATTTYAGGPIANCNSGTPFTWGGGGANIPFNPDQGDLGPVDNAAATALVQQAFDVWGAVPTSTASYINAGQLPVDVDITNFNPYLNAAAPDGFSAIVFDDDGAIFDLLFGPNSGILGFAGPEWGNTGTCTIFEGLSFLNGPSFSNTTAALDVMVHEFGHYSALDHTVVNGQAIGFGDASGPSPNNTFGAPASITQIETMYPIYFGTTSGTASLHKDDIASLSTLYPSAGFASSTAAISGTIYASNGTTKVTGVNVIARNIADPFNDAVSAISSDFTDSTSQADPVVGTYKIEGLTPGADYAVYVDEILAGGFSTSLSSPLPGPEEFYNMGESNNISSPDDPSVYTGVAVSAGNTVAGTDIIFNVLGPGDPLPVGWDGNVEISLPFTYEICGQPFDSVFVNANGNLTFGSGDFDFSESAFDMVDDPRPRIAGLWDDLDSRVTGSVFYTLSKNAITFHWDSIPETFTDGSSNTFTITLKKASNHIDVQYGDLTATDGLGGVSCGGTITSRFETPVDLTSFGKSRINLHNQPAVFEQWGFGNPNDVANKTVRYNGTTNYNDNWAENNDTLKKARNISLPFNSIPITRYTEIEPTGGDVDYYRFDLPANTSLIADIQTGGLDSLIALFDPDGNLVAADDDGGAGLLSRIVYPVPTSGKYTLAVTTFPDFGLTGAGGSGGRYVMDLRTIDGIVLNLGDDGNQEVPLGFTFPFNGNNYTSVYVNANGNLTFGAPAPGSFGGFLESAGALVNGPPRIAMLWDDLNSSAGGLILVKNDPGSATFTWDSVPEFISTGSNTFSATLYSSGQIDVSYGSISAVDGLAGVSPGGGVADPGGSDLSSTPNWSATGTTYELFDFGNPNDLSGLTLNYTP